MVAKTKTLNEYNAKNNTSVSLAMSNDQKTFTPHWINRYSSDFIADTIATTTNEDLKKITTRNEFNKFVTDALNVAYGCTLEFNEYDFSGKHTRTEVIERATAKADKTPKANDEANAYIKAIKEALNVAVKSGVSVTNEMLKAKIESEVPKELQTAVKNNWEDLRVSNKPSISSF